MSARIRSLVVQCFIALRHTTQDVYISEYKKKAAAKSSRVRRESGLDATIEKSKRMTTNDFDASGALSNQITQQVIAIGKKGLRFYPGRQSRMRFQAPSPLAKLAAFTPGAPGFVSLCPTFKFNLAVVVSPLTFFMICAAGIKSLIS